jgi:ubiquinone/menaquinone biosynthesis C-methylase UbiE
MERRELQASYNRAARWYDLAEALPELLGLQRLRRKLAGVVRGRVVEVACGTGKNFHFYPSGQQLIAVDLSLEMLKRARSRSRHLGLVAHFAVMDGEELPIRTQAADTVLSSLTLCTFPRPTRALREMARICRREGQILLLEHGRSDRPWLGQWQDRRAAPHARTLGCHWNREPLELVREAGLRVDQARRWFLGIFHLIVARPGN